MPAVFGLGFACSCVLHSNNQFPIDFTTATLSVSRARSWKWDGQEQSGFTPYCKTRTAVVVRPGAADVHKWGWPAVLVSPVECCCSAST